MTGDSVDPMWLPPANVQMRAFRVMFQRIGRSRSVPDLNLRAVSCPQDLATRIRRYARGFGLTGRLVSVTVDMSLLQGRIYTVWQVDGCFTFSELAAQPAFMHNAEPSPDVRPAVSI